MAGGVLCCYYTIAHHPIMPFTLNHISHSVLQFISVSKPEENLPLYIYTVVYL